MCNAGLTFLKVSYPYYLTLKNTEARQFFLERLFSLCPKRRMKHCKMEKIVKIKNLLSYKVGEMVNNGKRQGFIFHAIILAHYSF